MAIVETRRITKFFDDVRAVDGIDLMAKEGEFLVLLGPSGCGKTTLMRMIAGLERPTSGNIVIDGNIVNDLPPRARNVAMVFQSYALYPHLTVEKNISFPLRAVGMPKDEIRKKIDWAAQMFGIQRFLDRKPRQLSGRDRQIGTPHEIYGYPADIFAATFIGSPPMNLIEDGKTWIGFRPEAFLPKEIESNGDNVEFAFRITRIEYLGADRLVYGLIDGRAPETRLISKIPTNIRTHIDAGRVYDFVVRRQDIARFGREDGRRMDGGAA